MNIFEIIINFFRNLFGSKEAPKSKFNLDKWELQLPVNSLGGFSGSMKTIEPATTYKPWFIASDSKLVFTCPAKGATSPNSESPRTELRERSTWLLEKGGTMSATLTVNAIPSGGTTIGQVWNQSQALRLSVNADGKIKTAGGGLDSTVVGDFVFGTPFTYFVEVKGNTLNLQINGVHVWSRDVSAWAGKTMYFKAGAYCHATEGTDPKAEFKVTFTDLVIKH